MSLASFFADAGVKGSNLQRAVAACEEAGVGDVADLAEICFVDNQLEAVIPQLLTRNRIEKALIKSGYEQGRPSIASAPPDCSLPPGKKYHWYIYINIEQTLIFCVILFNRL